MSLPGEVDLGLGPVAGSQQRCCPCSFAGVSVGSEEDRLPYLPALPMPALGFSEPSKEGLVCDQLDLVCLCHVTHKGSSCHFTALFQVTQPSLGCWFFENLRADSTASVVMLGEASSPGLMG